MTHAAVLGFGRFDDVRFVRLIGAEGVAAVFGVGPAGADEALAAGPVFGEVVEEAAWYESALYCPHDMHMGLLDGDQQTM